MTRFRNEHVTDRSRGTRPAGSAFMDTHMTVERPWPEAAAGAVIGMMLAMSIAFVPGLSRLFDNTGTTVAVLAAGALIGAAVSWWMAGRSPVVARAEDVAERDVTVQEAKRRHAA